MKKDFVTMAVLISSFIAITYTLIMSAFNGYVISVATNRYSEAVIEISGALVLFPFIIWRSMDIFRRLMKK